MTFSEIQERLGICPLVASVHEDRFEQALESPTQIVFVLEGTVITVADQIRMAHERGKAIFVHIDLMRGIGKDRCGVEYLVKLGADGIISTKASLIKSAKELGVIAVQRYFAIDSQGLESIRDMITATRPDFIEILPGVINKVIARFVLEDVPVIAGGLIETKAEVMAALGCGAVAVSTGTQELWTL